MQFEICGISENVIAVRKCKARELVRAFTSYVSSAIHQYCGPRFEVFQQARIVAFNEVAHFYNSNSIEDYCSSELVGL